MERKVSLAAMTTFIGLMEIYMIREFMFLEDRAVS